MKDFILKNYKYIIVILITVIIMSFFINKKEGFHEDEIFSYGSSSFLYDNVFRPYGVEDATGIFIRNYILKGNIIKNLKYYYIDNTPEKDTIIEQYENEQKPIWKTKDDAHDYITINSWREAINYIIPYYNQSKDVHPPLFYLAVHTIQIIFYARFTKYIIFSINLIFMVFSLIKLKQIFEKINKEYLSIPAMILYGFSIGAISTVIFQRMYMMLTFFVLSFISINLDVIKNDFEIDKKTWIKLGVITLLGYLTQYYFCIFAVGVIGIIFANICRKKNKKKIISFVLNYLKIALIGLVLYPFSINHIFFSYRGVGVSEMHKSFIQKLGSYLNLISYSYSVSVLIIGLIIIAMIVYLIVKRKQELELNKYIFLLLLPSFLYIIIITKTAPEVEYRDTIRYIMCLLPVFAILCVLGLDMFIKNKKVSQILLSCTFLAVSVYGITSNEPFALFKGYNKYIEIANNNKDDRFVYVGDTVFNHIQSMPEFAIYKESLILNDELIDYLIGNEELKNENEFIISIKKYKDYQHIINRITNETDFKEYELLLDDSGDISCIIYRMKRSNKNEV